LCLCAIQEQVIRLVISDRSSPRPARRSTSSIAACWASRARLRRGQRPVVLFDALAINKQPQPVLEGERAVLGTALLFLERRGIPVAGSTTSMHFPL
jgi:hypothetical protein